VLAAGAKLEPENSCEAPQLGNTEGSEVAGGGPLEVVVLGIVVFWTVALDEFDWSAVIEGGVWMALESDESAEEVCN
jgi:hypothetical protein